MWEFALWLPDSTHLAQHQLGAPSRDMPGSFQLCHGFGCVPGDPKIPGVTRLTGRDEERVTDTTRTIPSACPSSSGPVATSALPCCHLAATPPTAPSTRTHGDRDPKSSHPSRLSSGATAGPTAELPTPPKQRKSLGLSKLSLFQMLKDEFFVLSALINQPKYILFF